MDIPSRGVGINRRIGPICGGRFPAVIHHEAFEVKSRVQKQGGIL